MMKKCVEKVAVVECKDYNQTRVDTAVKKALELIDFKFEKGKKVLIKPNVVGCFPKKQIATTTNPSIVEAVCKILKKNKCKIFIGDSPFTNPEASFKASGIDKVAKKYGKQVIFEQDKLVNVKNDKAKVLKNFKVAKTVKDVDLIINLPKLKTHSLTKYTGAIKNFYGLIPGGIKQRTHMHAKGDKKFSKVLVDIFQNITPDLTIMDAVIGMEGEGPTSGDPTKTGLILASKNGVALDIVTTRIIGLNPKKVYMIKEAVRRKLYSGFKVLTVGKNPPKLNFKIPSNQSKSLTKKMLCKLFKEKPIVCDTKKCVKCGLCASKCPAKAISLKPYPIVDSKKCIRCFCCIEICPQEAMGFKK